MQQGPVCFTLDNNDGRRCPGLEVDDVPIGWSVDGRALFSTRQRGLTVDVHRLDFATGRRTLLRSLSSLDPAGASPPGTGPTSGVHLTPDGKYYAYSFIRDLSALYLVDGLK
jgi:hypothetical protein